MKISGKHYRTIWPREDGTVEIIDQTKLPHRVRDDAFCATFRTRRMPSRPWSCAARR